MPMIDARARGLDALFTRGNEFVLTITWPAGALAGRTFTASLDAAVLTVGIVGDVMAVTVSEAQSTAAVDSGVFTLTETTGGGTQALMVGIWGASDLAAASDVLSVDVVTDGAEVVVEYPTIPSAVGSLTVAGDLTISGEILSGTLAGGNTFGGIQREARPFTSGVLVSGALQMNQSGLPRIEMPNNGFDSTVQAVFQVEEWWLETPAGDPGTIGVYFEWVNDHSTTGDVRFDCAIRAYKIGQDTIAGGGTLMGSRTFTQVSAAADVQTTSIVASVANGNPAAFPAPGPLASSYCLTIIRKSGDAADTLAGPIGIVSASMTRGQ